VTAPCPRPFRTSGPVGSETRGPRERPTGMPQWGGGQGSGGGPSRMFSIHPSKSEEAKSLKLQELDPPFGFLSACTGMVVVECSASGSVGSAAGSRHPDACRGSAWAPVHGHPRIGSPPHRCHNNQPSAICSPRGVAPADRGARGVSPPVRARTSRGSGCVSPAPPHPSASRPLQNGPGRNAALGGGG